MIPPKSKILTAQGLHCSRELPGELPTRLRGLSLAFEDVSLSLLAGPPGCGKNLLLRILGLLELPDEGVVSVHGSPTDRLSPGERTGIRNQFFGFLFGEPFLLPSFSALENIAMPFFKISAPNTQEARLRTEAMLEFVGMAEHAQVSGSELSMPEQKRVALARALVNHPEILLIEEVDRNLAGQDLLSFIELVQRAVAELKVTAVATISSLESIAIPERIVEMADGRIRFDSASDLPAGGFLN